MDVMDLQRRDNNSYLFTTRSRDLIFLIHAEAWDDSCVTASTIAGPESHQRPFCQLLTLYDVSDKWLHIGLDLTVSAPAYSEQLSTSRDYIVQPFIPSYNNTYRIRHSPLRTQLATEKVSCCTKCNNPSDDYTVLTFKLVRLHTCTLSTKSLATPNPFPLVSV